MYISYRCFGRPSLSHGIIVDLHLDVGALFVYVCNLYHCVFSLKPQVPSDPCEAFLTILQKMTEMAHVFAVGICKQSE